MKESEVAGLMELRKEYSEKLRGLKGYQELSKELEAKSLDLIRAAVKKAQIRPDQSPALLMEEKGDTCGFCKDCITDTCVQCVGCIDCTLWN